MTSRILDVMYFNLLPDMQDVGGHVDDVRWTAVLNAASAFEMYRQRFGPIAPNRVADFLILDRDFPRSIKSCVTNADESLHAISNSPIPGLIHLRIIFTNCALIWKVPTLIKSSSTDCTNFLPTFRSGSIWPATL